MPLKEGYRAWAAGLDVLALPDDLAYAMREYVARYPKLTPVTQDALGVALLVVAHRAHRPRAVEAVLT